MNLIAPRRIKVVHVSEEGDEKDMKWKDTFDKEDMLVMESDEEEQ